MQSWHTPAGTVTLMFTDIEGSTALWEAHPGEMRVALARHDEIASSIISQSEGTIVKSRGEGDSLFAVFPLATDAARAACALQAALLRESWPDSISLRVRMALHTGEAELREGDYFGSAVNRCARLRAIGHGGQILASAATQELVRDALPEGCSLEDLGAHHLKDLGRPETVFQLCHSSLPSEFPALRSLDLLPNNLRRQLTSFVGREAEVEKVKELLQKTALLTLTGSGGCGKTRLALQAAADMLDASADGAWLVELASLADPALVPQTVAAVLSLKPGEGKSLTQTLADSLRNKHLLLVLDNCEHLLDACAQLADALLRQCPHVLILATSREGLGIAGETTYRVPSLSVPDPKQPQTPVSLSHYESVRLFIERALQVQTAFTVTNQNAPALATICHRLDGIPLAIELAAARVRSLSVEEVNQRLDQRFRLLTGGSRTALPRQQTLRSLIDWSYDLLDEPEKSLLCRVSVFSGGWTLEAAEHACSGGRAEEWQTLDLLTSLADKSLVGAEQHLGATRYRLLETVRQYARDRLLEGGDGEEWRDRHLAHFLSLAEEAAPHLEGADQAWLERLEAEHDNMRGALEWSLTASPGPEAGLRLAGAIWWFWFVRGHYAEGRAWLSGLLAAEPAGQSKAARAKALNGAGLLAWRQGELLAARALLEESQAIRRELGDRMGMARSLNNLGLVAWGHRDSARALFEECLAIWRELGDRRGIATSLANLGGLAVGQGDYAVARTLLEESLALLRELGNRHIMGITLSNLGIVAHGQGDYAAARTIHEESLAIRREIGDRLGMADSLEELAAVAALERPDRAARILGATERLREEIGAPLPASRRSRYEGQVATARAAIADEDAFDRAWQEGRSLTLEHAIELALQESTHQQPSNQAQ